MSEKKEVARLPIPERLEPKSTKRSLMVSVRIYFFSLYNSTNAAFRNFLVSVKNEDSISKNRMFDRHEAVLLIKKAAIDTKDTLTATAEDGLVYECLVKIMRANNLGLKLRRKEYERLTHQAPAE